MANRQSSYDTLASNLIKNSLKNLQGLLVAIGKPFFVLLSYSIIGLFLFFQFLGKGLKFIFLGFLLLLVEIVIKTPKIIVSMYRYIDTNIRKIQRFKIALFKRKKTRKKPPVRRTSGPEEKKLFPQIKFPKPKLRHTIAFFLLFLFSLAIFAAWHTLTKDLPSPTTLTTRDLEVSTKIYDRNGTLLYNIYKDKNRTPVPLEEIPLRVRLATLAIEDAEFYNHPGFSIRGIFRAALKNLKEGELTGGSTITQQLVKNTLLTSEKTLERKLREVILAIQVEMEFSKDEILEMYLNEVSYGGTAYGIQAAAKVYFDKDVDKLSLAEAALLAGLPKSPTKYSPFGSNPELANKRQKQVLNLMKINKYITSKQLENATNEIIVFADNKASIKAPHFVMYVREYLEEKYGKEIVETGGLEVTTTLDYDIQRLAEKVVQEEVESLKDLNVGNGAAIVIAPQTGEILAMVGSKDYFDTQSDGNVNVTLRPRQPGSSIKIVNYAYALSNGLSPATIINDSPVTFRVEGQPDYTPKNYDGKFTGSLTLRNAFAQSRNVPAVKVLATYGVEKMIETGRAMGITTWTNPYNYGLSLTLGGGEVKLIDLAYVYATVANYGVRPYLSPVVKVKNYKGKILEENKCGSVEKKGRFDVAGVVKELEALESNSDNNSEEVLAASDEKEACRGEKVLDEKIAFMLIDILKDNSARAPAFGINSLLNIPDHLEVAVKTGTSNDLRDNLTVGFNQNYLVAVWVGNNDNSQMSRVASGITGATPIWNKIMSALLLESDNKLASTESTQQENNTWPVPEGLVKSAYCTLTGSLPCRGCPTAHEWFLEENAPTRPCNPEVIKKIFEEKKDKEKDKKSNSDEVIWGRLLDPAATDQR